MHYYTRLTDAISASLSSNLLLHFLVKEKVIDNVHHESILILHIKRSKFKEKGLNLHI